MARRSYALYVNNERLGTFRYRDGADTSQIADHLKSQHPNLDTDVETSLVPVENGATIEL